MPIDRKANVIPKGPLLHHHRNGDVASLRIAFLSLRVWKAERYDMKEEEEEEEGEKEKERCRRRRRRTRQEERRRAEAVGGKEGGGWVRKGWKAKTVNVPLPLFLSRWIIATAFELHQKDAGRILNTYGTKEFPYRRLKAKQIMRKSSGHSDHFGFYFLESICTHISRLTRVCAYEKNLRQKS